MGIVAVIDHYNHDRFKVSNDIRNLLGLIAFIVSLLLANRIRKVRRSETSEMSDITCSIILVVILCGYHSLMYRLVII